MTGWEAVGTAILVVVLVGFLAAMFWPIAREEGWVYVLGVVAVVLGVLAVLAGIIWVGASLAFGALRP